MKIFSLDSPEVEEALKMVQGLTRKPLFQVESLCDMDRFSTSEAVRRIVRCWLTSGDIGHAYLKTFGTLLCLRHIANQNPNQSPIADRLQSLQEFRDENQTLLDACKHLKAAAELVGLPKEYFLEYPQPIWEYPSSEEFLDFSDSAEAQKVREELAYANFCEMLFIHNVDALPSRRDVGRERQAVRDLVLAIGVSLAEFKNKRLFSSYAKTLQRILQFADLDVSEDLVRIATKEAYKLDSSRPELPALNKNLIQHLESKSKFKKTDR